METVYKYISFQKINSRFNTRGLYRCVNNKGGGVLGLVKYYSYWRRFCFMPEGDTVFSADCLDDISHFLGEIN